MRVTKIIREYVEKEVGKKFNFKSEAEEKLDLLNEQLLKAKREIEEKVYAFADKLAKEKRKELDLPEDVTFNCDDYRYSEKEKHYTRCISFGFYDSELLKQAGDNRQERESKKRKAIDEILVSLELGASKDELAEMINNIKVD